MTRTRKARHEVGPKAAFCGSNMQRDPEHVDGLGTARNDNVVEEPAPTLAMYKLI
eukprot:SAG31_NODE_32_length_32319_cov_28.042681_6_plen_55_part_00